MYTKLKLSLFRRYKSILLKLSKKIILTNINFSTKKSNII